VSVPATTAPKALIDDVAGATTFAGASAQPRHGAVSHGDELGRRLAKAYEHGAAVHADVE